MTSLLAEKMLGNYNASFSRQHTVNKPFFELFGIFVHTQCPRTSESILILWSSCELKLAKSPWYSTLRSERNGKVKRNASLLIEP